MLHNLATDLGNQHRHREAIELLTESIALRRQVGQTGADLIRSYYRRAFDHDAIRQRDQAVADARTAVALAEDLAKKDPLAEPELHQTVLEYSQSLEAKHPRPS